MLASATTVLLAALLLAQAEGSVGLVEGWEQVDAESYHGPEGWYHDSVSGALVQYWAGNMPNEAGEGPPPTGAPCVVSAPDAEPPRCLQSETGHNLHIFIGPYTVRPGLAPVPQVSMIVGRGAYASYRATFATPQQLQRAKEFALTNPLARRLYSGHEQLARDARESDLRAVALGMSLQEVLRVLGDPVSMEASGDAGFMMEYIVWGQWPLPTGKMTLASRTVKLAFSRDRKLLKRPRARPPNDGLERTRPS